MHLLRNRSILIFLSLIVLGIAIGSIHNRALEAGKPFVVTGGIRSALLPANTAVHMIFAVGDRAKKTARPRYLILRENAALKKEVRRLAKENAQLREAAAENVRLRLELDLKKEKLPPDSISAMIVARNESNWFDSATINRGKTSGAEVGMAVVNHWGLVGQVVQVDSYTSQIVALTDRDSSVGARVQRSRSAGIVRGQAGDYLVLAYLPKDADVKKDDIVVSSGMGGVIPQGLPIGRVVKVVRDSVGGTTSALLRPSVPFDQVEHVFLVKSSQVKVE